MTVGAGILLPANVKKSVRVLDKVVIVVFQLLI
jgi:hypothetical protein